MFIQFSDHLVLFEIRRKKKATAPVLGAELGNEILPVSYCHGGKLTYFPEILPSLLPPFTPFSSYIVLQDQVHGGHG